MALQDKVGTRYAKAILEAVADKGQVRNVLSELETFSALVEGHPELKLVLTSAAFGVDARSGVISDLADKLKVRSETRRSLLVISEEARMKELPTIVEKLHLLLLESSGTIPLSVLTATDLSADEKKKLEARFKKVLGKEVEATYETEPTLLGGVRVTAGGRTYDGSVSGWLNTFEEQLVGGQF